MSPRSTKQFEEMREEKKDLIMENAMELFAHQGFHATSISQIAKKARISKGLMYNYFTSKDELLMAIIDSGMNEMLNQFDVNHDGIITKAELLHFVHFSFNSLRENRKFWRLYFTLFIHPDVFSKVEEKFSDLQKHVSQLTLTFFINEGYADPKNEMIAFGAMLDGISFQYVITEMPYPLDEMENFIIKKYKLEE